MRPTPIAGWGTTDEKVPPMVPVHGQDALTKGQPKWAPQRPVSSLDKKIREKEEIGWQPTHQSLNGTKQVPLCPPTINDVYYCYYYHCFILKVIP